MDGLEVKIAPHTAIDTSTSVPCEVTFAQYQCWVKSEALKKRNETGMLMVGYIGTHDGANFCPTQEYYGFGYKHRTYIVDEVKRQHGRANPEPPVDVPPHFDPELEEIE